MQVLDKSVIKGRIGVLRTQARTDLDNQLQGALNKPERLTSPGVYAQNQRLIVDARKVKNPGTRLSNQINQLDKLLRDLQRPVSVQLKSNNQTKVTLYKIGDLGSFAAKSMDLKPGKYTLIGTRAGFRDVRQEFTLMPNKPLTTIVVQCDEKITNG